MITNTSTYHFAKTFKALSIPINLLGIKAIFFFYTWTSTSKHCYLYTYLEVCGVWIYCIQGNIHPRFIFAHFALIASRSENKFLILSLLNATVFGRIQDRTKPFTRAKITLYTVRSTCTNNCTYFHYFSVTVLDPGLLRRDNGTQNNERIGGLSTNVIMQVIAAWQNQNYKDEASFRISLLQLTETSLM